MKARVAYIGSTSLLFLILLAMIFVPLSASAQMFDDTDKRTDYFSRMFIAPSGRIMPSGVLSFAFGGAFASQGGREYLGLFSVGLGGVAEFEVSTTHLVTNVLNLSEPIGTTALRFTIFQGNPEKKIPSIVMALQSNRWSDVQGEESDLAGPANPDGPSNIGGIDFEAHITTLYLAASADLTESISTHGGIVFSEIRTRGLEYYNITGDATIPPGDMRKNLFMMFCGIERQVNPNTFSMFEFGGLPSIEFDDNLRKMTAKPVWYSMAGIRFFITEMTAIDAGLRYRSDFTGLADTEIRAGLNMGFDIGKEIRGKLKK